MTVNVRRSAIATTAIATVVILAYLIVWLLGSDPGDLSMANDAKDSTVASEDVVTAEVLAANGLARDDADGSALKTPEGGSTSLQVASRFTGDAEVDLRDGARDVIVIPDLSGGVQQRDVLPPDPAVPPQFEMGWDIKDVRLKYVAITDELIIALNSYGVVGDPEGNGDPESFDQTWTNALLDGQDNADLGTSEGVTFALDLDSDGSYDLAVGTHYENNIIDFGVHEYVDANPSPAVAAPTYGDRIDTLGTAPNSPSFDAPDLIFSIANFSMLPGNDESLDFGINVLNGSEADGNIGEDSLGDFDVAVPVRLNAEIGDLVWSDSNENGIQDAGEPGIGGVTVNLRTGNADLVDSMSTGPDGTYNFLVAPGNYFVEFVAPPKAVFSRRFAIGNEEADSDPDSSGRTTIVSVRTGGSDLTIDAGIIEFVPSPSIDIETATEGLDADTPPGPELNVGSTVTFTYLVTNTGDVPLTNVTVTDDQGVVVNCPASDLGVLASMGCTASAVVVEGPYSNLGSVVATPGGSDEDDLDPVFDEDLSNHVGIVPFVPAPAIDLETYTNGEDADIATGPLLLVGDEATFTYVAENTGNVDLIDVAISDDLLGDVCVIDLLPPGQSTQCTAFATVTEGPYVNLGSVEALAISPKSMVLETVTDEDLSHHVGALPGPACVATTHGPRMHVGGTVVDETEYVAAAGSRIYIVTSEPGRSPDQPNEQVYVQVGDKLYGPTPAGLGDLTITVEETGPVTILHYSVVNDDTSHSNSVEYDWCGTDLTIPTPHTCPATLSGPRMHRGGIVSWDTELIAAPGSTISITTSEPGESPGQPNEQVYVQVGEEQFGPTPNEHGTTTFAVGAGGRVVVQHYSVINEESTGGNSVEVEICGSGFTEANQ